MAVAAADRGPIVTSHGHNDVFALDVCASGVRFLGEMGCAPYGNSPGRDYDQRTEAHNCLGIDGWEQAPIVSEWRWSGLVIPQVRRWISTDTHDFLHGVHEGFYRWPEHQTIHARKVLFIKSEPSYWLVLDWVESNVENPYVIWFHGCAPGRLEGRTIMLGEEGGPRLAVVPPAGDALHAERAFSDGLKAYVEEKGMDPENYPCFAYRKRAVSDCFVWAIAPLGKDQAAPEVKRISARLAGREAESHVATAVEVALPGRSPSSRPWPPGHTDRVCVSHKSFDAALEFGTEAGWGHLAFRRRDAQGGLVLSFDHTMADGACGR
jgi:hypothetical protein